MELHEFTDAAIDYIFLHLDEDDLSNDWEIRFVPSARGQWQRRRWLSDDQKIALGKIWEKQK